MSAWRTRTVEKMLVDDRLRSDPNWLPRLVRLAERDATAGGTKNLARRWANLSSALWLVWLATEDAGQLAACLGAAQRAADAVAGSADAGPLRRNYAFYLLRYYQVSAIEAALDEALAVLVDLLPETGRGAAPEVLLLADLALHSDSERRGRRHQAAAPVEERFVLALVEVDDAMADAYLGFLQEQGDADALNRTIERLDRAPRALLATRARRCGYAHARGLALAARSELSRSPDDLDAAIDCGNEAVKLAVPADRRASDLRRYLANYYATRSERDGTPDDLSTAIGLLEPDSDLPLSQFALMRLRWQRYESTADLADLEAALALSRQLRDEATLDPELRAGALENLRRQLTARQLFRDEPGLADELDEVSAEAGAPEPSSESLQRPEWTRTYGDDDHVSEPKRMPAGARRVLYLRTFRDDSADVFVLQNLAAALKPEDRIVVLSDARDEDVLAAIGDRLELITTTDADWTRAVHKQIATADAVVVHLSPKTGSFPRRSLSPHRPVAGHDWTAAMTAGSLAYESTPVGEIPTGAGVLREFSYLERLERLDRTVAVADNAHFYHLVERASTASLGDGITPYHYDGTVAQPKVSVLERQLASLMAEARGVTFTASTGGGLSPAFVSALATALADVVRDRPPPTDDERCAAVRDLPLGVSPQPRRLPPDGELKVISYTPVEDLLYIPRGAIVEISRSAVEAYLTKETAAHGCPRCDAPLSSVFFYTPDASRAEDPDLSKANVRGKCQSCGRLSYVVAPDNFTSL
jgi:hypothetical protein